MRKIFTEINIADINKNFLGVFLSDKINKFIIIEKITSGKIYSFIISNTGRSNGSVTPWWSISNILPKSEILFFGSLGISGMKGFIVTDDKKNKVLKGLELADKRDNKLTLIKLKLPMNGYKNLAEKEIFSLSSAVQDFFHRIYSFGKNKNLTNFVNVWMLEDPFRWIQQ